MGHLIYLCSAFLPPSSWMRNSCLETRVLWCGPSWFYLGSVQPLKFLLLGLPPCCLLHTPGQLGIQFLLCVSSWLERTRDFLSQVPEMFGHWLARKWRTPLQAADVPAGQTGRPEVWEDFQAAALNATGYISSSTSEMLSRCDRDRRFSEVLTELMQQRDICFFIVGITCFSYKDVCSF